MRILVVIWMIWVALACAKDGEVQKTPEPQAKSFRYLALGDSYTIGTAIGRDSSYAALLRDSLRLSRADSIYYEVIATNGWTTHDLTLGLDTAAPDSNFDVVSLLIGVNNQYQGLTIEEYRSEFLHLATEAIALSQGDPRKVMVYSIPDWGVSPAGAGNRRVISLQIDAFNAAQKEVCDSLQLDFYDITQASRQALQDPSLIASDGLHFSVKMHQEWMRSTYQDWLQKLQLP